MLIDICFFHIYIYTERERERERERDCNPYLLFYNHKLNVWSHRMDIQCNDILRRNKFNDNLTRLKFSSNYFVYALYVCFII